MNPPIKMEQGKYFFDKRNIQLVLLVVIASAALTVINFYSLKITSAVRAYINGESQYSKGQKDATSHLITYLSTGDDKRWNAFEEDLKIPIGDSLARVGLLYDSSNAFIRVGFLQGKNHEEDIDNMMWLFRNFRETYFMKDPVKIWTEADVLIGQLKNLGNEVHAKWHVLNPAERDEVLMRVHMITAQLSIQERAFSDALGANARKINTILFAVNIFGTLIIISVVVYYAYKGYQQLLKTQSDLRRSNMDLININQELDNFIYAASHDLKSPINNLEGLTTLWKLQTPLDANGLELLEKMQYSITKLKKTITGLSEVMKTDKSPMDDVEENSFESILNEFKLENNFLLQEAGAEITTDFGITKITYSKVGMKSIIQNLLTNAVKYRSPVRKCVIHIKSYAHTGKVILQVSDNGLGMDLESNRGRLFKLFNRLHDHVEGTGVGLYMIKRIVEKNGGSILVDSQLDKGTTFSITLN